MRHIASLIPRAMVQMRSRTRILAVFLVLICLFTASSPALAAHADTPAEDGLWIYYPYDEALVHVNEIDHPVTVMGKSFLTGSALKFIPMTIEEMYEWYGYYFDISLVLPDFSLIPGNYGITKHFDPSTGSESYTANNTFRFSTSDGAAVITLSFPGATRFFLFPQPDAPLTSTVNAVDMDIFHYRDEENNSRFFTQFYYNGHQILLQAANVGQDQFLHVIAYLTSRGHWTAPDSSMVCLTPCSQPTSADHLGPISRLRLLVFQD